MRLLILDPSGNGLPCTTRPLSQAQLTKPLDSVAKASLMFSPFTTDSMVRIVVELVNIQFTRNGSYVKVKFSKGTSAIARFLSLHNIIVVIKL